LTGRIPEFKVHGMNSNFEQEIRYHLLQILSRESELSQRDMAERIGISLGKVNFCVSELAKRGFIEIIRFKSAKNKMPYTYMLTPRGIQEKAILTVRFLKQKLVEYEEIKHQIRQLASELYPEDGVNIAKNEFADVLSKIS
jgi:EPS-associated MarR family transcriptional regulator